MRHNIVILCDADKGVHIPAIMIPLLKQNGWRNIPLDAEETVKYCENEGYWDVWNEVLDNAEWHEPCTGRVFTLHQDGDVFAVAKDSCTPQEYHNLFGEYPEWFNQDLEEA